MYDLTEEDFQIFKTECQKWLDFFGITEWEISYKFEYMDCRAECRVNWRGRQCILCLTTHRPKWEKFDVRKSAFHEVCELLLTEMEYTALDEEIPYSERKGLVESERHGVIRRLENSVFQKGTHYAL